MIIRKVYTRKKAFTPKSSNTPMSPGTPCGGAGDSFRRTVCSALDNLFPIVVGLTGSLPFWMASTTRMYSGPICVSKIAICALSPMDPGAMAFSRGTSSRTRSTNSRALPQRSPVVPRSWAKQFSECGELDYAGTVLQVHSRGHGTSLVPRDEC
jgi:hypothetical protein